MEFFSTQNATYDWLLKFLSMIKKMAEKMLRKGKRGGKFPHSPILHYACGSMYVVHCFATKKQKSSPQSQATALFLPLFSVNNDLQKAIISPGH